MYTMAKTLMISNEVYEELTSIKKDKSYSEVIKELINKKDKKGSKLKECLGILKKDKEWDSIEKNLKEDWKAWNKKYV